MAALWQKFALTRRRLIYTMICGIVILVFYMESNILSINLSQHQDGPVQLIGNDQYVVLDRDKQPRIPKEAPPNFQNLSLPI